MEPATHLPALPVMDEALCAEAERLATGAHIHTANTLLGIYRNSVWGAQRLAGMMEAGTCWEAKPGEITPMEDLAARIAMARDYAGLLHSFVVRQRLARLRA